MAELKMGWKQERNGWMSVLLLPEKLEGQPCGEREAFR